MFELIRFSTWHNLLAQSSEVSNYYDRENLFQCRRTRRTTWIWLEIGSIAPQLCERATQFWNDPLVVPISLHSRQFTGSTDANVPCRLERNYHIMTEKIQNSKECISLLCIFFHACSPRQRSPGWLMILGTVSES